MRQVNHQVLGLKRNKNQKIILAGKVFRNALIFMEMRENAYIFIKNKFSEIGLSPSKGLSFYKRPKGDLIMLLNLTFRNE